jgi:hypothetical protein
MNDKSINDLLARIREQKVDVGELPIPQPDASLTLTKYTQIPAADALDDSPLVNLLELGFAGANFYRTNAVHNPLYLENLESACRGIWIRKKLVPSLQETEQMLNRYSLRLFLLDGYRSLACQKEVREKVERYWVRQIGSYMNPNAVGQLAQTSTDRFISPAPDHLSVTDSSSWFAHSTGGALWTAATSIDGCPVEFGCLFEDIGNPMGSNYYEEFSPRNLREKAAQRTRRILFWCLMANGWVNYPHIIFHFNFFSSGLRSQLGIQSARNWGLTVPGEQEEANLGPVITSPEKG